MFSPPTSTFLQPGNGHVEITYFPLCYDQGSFFTSYLFVFPFFLFILPYLPWVGITQNEFADKMGQVYYLIPFGLGGLSALISRNWTITLRPYMQCLTPLHSTQAYPCFEIVVAISYLLVEILYYWGSFDTESEHYAWNARYIATRVVLIGLIPPLSVMTYTATSSQSIASLGFSLLTIPIFLTLMWWLHSKWYLGPKKWILRLLETCCFCRRQRERVI